MFSLLGLNANNPLVLAPLAGVSDFPFRRLCHDYGAQLTYIEMLSSQPIIRGNRRTLAMMACKKGNGKLGVQLTGQNPDEIGAAVRILDDHDYDTIDINMGCPVRKVVNSGCGSALLRDERLVHQVVARARQATSKPLSVKIRLGWDRQHLNYLAVGKAASDGGADWLTVHGRTRSENYSRRVDLDAIKTLRAALPIPVIGNGDLLAFHDYQRMLATTGVAACMIARGAMGNPWIFRYRPQRLGVDEWQTGVLKHLHYQQQEYGDSIRAISCMRKHLLWYLKGWSGSKPFKEQVLKLESFAAAQQVIADCVALLNAAGVVYRNQSDYLCTYS
ncbi:MAG: tRNA dihydrouridine synthase DusB [Pseudomonadota bacterium]|nr:tRNA dihydrouridine synthase DusB [Pseudomonadota bacterium]